MILLQERKCSQRRRRTTIQNSCNGNLGKLSLKNKNTKKKKRKIHQSRYWPSKLQSAKKEECDACKRFKTRSEPRSWRWVWSPHSRRRRDYVGTCSERTSRNPLAFSVPLSLLIWVSISFAVTRKPGHTRARRTPSVGGRAAPPCAREPTLCGADSCPSRAGTCKCEQGKGSLEKAQRIARAQEQFWQAH